MARESFFSAANQDSHDYGYVLMNEDSEYFCGFLQEDGSILSGPFIQNADGFYADFAEIENSKGYDKILPMFLSADEMEDYNLSAVAYPTRETAAHFTGLIYEDRALCRVLEVNKDVATESLKDAPPPSGFDAYDLLAPMPKPLTGLASASACEAGIDKGFASIRTTIQYGLHRLFS